MSVGSVGRESLAVHAYEDIAAPTGTETSDVSSISTLIVGGDLGAQLAGLVIQNAKAQRDANHQLRDVQEHAIAREEAAQIQALHDKADDTRTAGWVSGAFGIASGGCTIAGSFASTAASPSANNTQPTESVARMRWKGSGEILGAVGSGFGGMAKGAIEDDEANAQSHAQAAGFYERSLNATRDSLRDCQDLLERVMDFYKGYTQGSNDAAKSSIGR